MLASGGVTRVSTKVIVLPIAISTLEARIRLLGEECIAIGRAVDRGIIGRATILIARSIVLDQNLIRISWSACSCGEV